MTERYLPVRSVPIRGFVHDEIQGISIPTSLIPFPAEARPNFSVVGTEILTDSEEDTPLRLVSYLHGRSYEFTRDGDSIWTDQYKNPFGAINTKGNNASYPEVCFSDLSGYVLHGMQESSSLARVLKASEYLRSEGIPTEMILQAIEPAELPYQGEVVLLDEYKKRLEDQAWKTDPDTDGKCVRMPHKKVTRADFTELIKAFHEMTLFITVRGVQVNERLADFMVAGTFEDMLPLLERSFQFANQAELLKAEEDPGYTPEQFDITKTADIFRYCTDYLPKSIARNLAGMHKRGLIHGFPHSGNISGVGTFYDLDSVRGEPLGLGDSKITLDEVVGEVKQVVTGGNRAFPPPNDISEAISGDTSGTFRRTFLRTYTDEMEWTGKPEYYQAVHAVWNGFAEIPDWDSGRYYRRQIRENLHLSEKLLPSEIRVSIMVSLLAEGRDAVITTFSDSIHELVDILVEQDKRFRPQALNPHISLEDSKTTYGVRQYLFSQVVEEIFDMNDELIDMFDLSFNKDVINDADRYRFLHAFMKREGVEGDILAYLPEVVSGFNDFQGDEASTYLPYYLLLIESQLGWSVDMGVTPEEMIRNFHEKDSRRFREDLERILHESRNEEDREFSLFQSFARSGQQHAYIWDHTSRYTDYYVDQIQEVLATNYGEKLANLSERYDASERNELKLFLEYAQFSTYSVMQDERADEINTVTRDRLEAILKARLGEEGINPDTVIALLRYSERGGYNSQAKADFIRQQGWEENIVQHLVEINEFFYSFGLLEYEEYFTYYLNLLKKELSYDLPFGEEEETKMMRAYYDDLSQEIHKLIDTTLVPDDRESIMKIITHLMLYDYLPSEESDPFNHLSEFIDEYVNRRIKQEYGDQIKQIILNQVHGEERVDQTQAQVYVMLIDEVERAFRKRYASHTSELLTKKGEIVGAVLKKRLPLDWKLLDKEHDDKGHL